MSADRIEGSNRASIWIAFLAGGWLATVLVGAAFLWGTPTVPLGQARAEDPPANGADPQTPNSLGTFERPQGGIPNPGGGTSDSNNRAIALSASVGGGESVVYYFDTEAQRVLVYQYAGRLPTGDRPLSDRDRGGLRLLAARHIDFDLRLEGYRDLSEQTRNQLKGAFETAAAKAPK